MHGLVSISVFGTCWCVQLGGALARGFQLQGMIKGRMGGMGSEGWGQLHLVGGEGWVGRFENA